MGDPCRFSSVVRTEGAVGLPGSRDRKAKRRRNGLFAPDLHENWGRWHDRVGGRDAGVEDPSPPRRLRRRQNDLFDVGADLCVPLSVDSPESGLRIQKGQVDRLEKAIDDNNANLKPLASFVLPGGTTASAHAHVARTVVRRAERQVVALGRMESLNPQLLIYLNRLSDLLFVLSRAYNNNGTLDVLWVPGVSRAGAVS